MAYVVVLDADPTRVEVSLEPMELGLLASIATQIAEFVAPDADVDPLVALVGLDPQAQAPQDPALLRLLPDAFVDDPVESARFRRFTERDLRESKRAAALTVLEAMSGVEQGSSGTIAFEGEEIKAWLGLLNDARLTIGARLGVTEDSHEELAALPDEDPRAGMYAVYDWLTYVQDATVTGLLGDD